MIDVFNKIGERNLLIINAVLSLIFYSIFKDSIDLSDVRMYVGCTAGRS